MPWRLIYTHIAIYSNFNDVSKVLQTKHHAQKPNKVSDEHYLIQIRSAKIESRRLKRCIKDRKNQFELSTTSKFAKQAT